MITHHRTGAIGLFAELDTALDQPIFVLLRADSAFDPAFRQWYAESHSSALRLSRDKVFWKYHG
jgi:hypothetical protein